MKKYIFALLLLAFMPAVQASNSIAHIYFAERFMEHFPKYTHEQKREFIVGTVFPDMRNIDPAIHDLTHLEGVTLQDVIDAETPFLAGWKLHCLVDDVRTAFMKEWGIFDQVSDLEVNRLGAFLKVVEDELVFNKCKRDFAILSLKKVYDAEREIEKEEQIILEWHRMNMVLLGTPPRLWLKKMTHHKQGYLHYSQKDLKSWDRHFKEALDREDIQVYFKALLDHFEELFTH